MLPRLLFLLCGLALLTAAPAHAMPAGAVTVSGKKADCLGGRGAPCASTVRGLMAPVAGAFTQDGRHFYVGSIAMGGLISMRRDPATGRLAPVQGGPGCIGYGEAGGYMEVAVAPDGRSVYAVAEGWNVHAFARDPATGALTRIAGKRGCVGMAKGCAWLEGVFDPEDIRLSPDGRHIYLAASGGVSVLRREADGGMRQLPGKAGCVMVRHGEVVPYGKGRQCHTGAYESRNVSGLEIAPGGRHLYVLQSNSDGRYGTGVVQLMRRH